MTTNNQHEISLESGLKVFTTLEPMDNATIACTSYAIMVETWFTFSAANFTRVSITWLLFAVSLLGNVFVLSSLRGDKKRCFIMFHLVLSNLAYTLFVMPLDAIWNTTMMWLAGDIACRLCQMMKQFGMYASSFMVVVIGTDRVIGILSPIPNDSQKQRGVVLVTVAWIASLLCSIPAGVIFSVVAISTCEEIPIYQCVDFNVVNTDLLPFYYIFTMCISFLVPLASTLVSYSLIVCEISKMKERDRVLMGRRNSVSTASIQKAKRKTIFMRTLLTFTFLICWTPYYGKGLHDWFVHYDNQEPPAPIDTAMYIAMYFNPVLQTLVFGIFLKQVRQNCYSKLLCSKPKMLSKKGRRRMSSSRGSFSSYATGTSQLLNSNNSRLSPSFVNSFPQNHFFNNP
ncbi:unnamed protein product [Clavelina lepadiformis]|uniref:G-protein coupled receptors family 1 profile domain-containing protein n=1 Tax=Clavelina lepadiformis TaxID=159417 RepID=A0ABP0G0C4_CLALP